MSRVYEIYGDFTKNIRKPIHADDMIDSIAK